MAAYERALADYDMALQLAPNDPASRYAEA